jgi:DNA-directed RNA polymerase subunit RPC12/RpoP
MTSIKKNMQKFYAVSTGRRVGIFPSWNIASQSVTGCAGATFKAYETMDQAKAAMRLAGFVDPHIFEEEESDPPTISGDKQSEMREVQQEVVNVEEREKHSEMREEQHEEVNVEEREEQSEMREEQHEEVNVEEREEEEEANNKKTGEHLEVEIKCWCHEEKKERTLKCSDCGHRIHWTCTELPIYQLCIFVNTQRKFTCQFCASKFMDKQDKRGIPNYHAIRQSQCCARRNIV